MTDTTNYHALAIINVLTTCFDPYPYSAKLGKYQTIFERDNPNKLTQLSTLSSVELRTILYLLLPHCVDSKVEKIKSVIKFIEKDISLMTQHHQMLGRKNVENEHFEVQGQQNGFDLVTENQELKNKVNDLEIQLKNIKKCVNK